MLSIAILKRIFGRMSKRRRIERNVKVRAYAEVRQVWKYVHTVYNGPQILRGARHHLQLKIPVRRAYQTRVD